MSDGLTTADCGRAGARCRFRRRSPAPARAPEWVGRHPARQDSDRSRASAQQLTAGRAEQGPRRGAAATAADDQQPGVCGGADQGRARVPDHNVDLDRNVGVGIGPRREGTGQVGQVDVPADPLRTGKAIVDLADAVSGVQHHDRTRVSSSIGEGVVERRRVVQHVVHADQHRSARVPRLAASASDDHRAAGLTADRQCRRPDEQVAGAAGDRPCRRPAGWRGSMPRATP